MEQIFLFCNNQTKNLVIRQFGNLIMQTDPLLPTKIIAELTHCRIIQLTFAQ